MNLEEAIQPLLDCMCTSLAEAGWEGSCCIHPGYPSFDSCCEAGGQAWARLIRMYPSSIFPQQDALAADETCNTATQWALVIEFGALRCVCFDLCDCAIKAENATKILNDSQAALKGLNCCFTSGPCKDTDYKINSLEIVGPESGCGGFKIELMRAFYLDCCSEDSP